MKEASNESISLLKKLRRVIKSRTFIPNPSFIKGLSTNAQFTGGKFASDAMIRISNKELTALEENDPFGPTKKNF